MTDDPSSQTVHGPQTNIAGNVDTRGGMFNAGIVNIQAVPLQPTRAIPPAPPPDFVGRIEQLAQLAAILTTGRSAAIMALQGMGGIGKTALALQLANQLTSHFIGGIFWGALADHNGSAEPILRTWGAFCGADLSREPDPNVLADRVRGQLHQRRDTQGMLLAVLDDVRGEWLATARLLKQSLPNGTPLLLTMRDVDLAIALDAEVIRLDVLSAENAHELLVSRVKPREILTPEVTVKALLKHLGYLPMAIRLAAGYVSKFILKPGFDLNQFVADVAQRAMSLLDATGGSGLAATFAISYDALTTEQQRVFRYCSIYSPALLTVEHITGLLGLEFAIVEVALDELVTVALLEWDREVVGQYVLHPLLRQYGYNLLSVVEDIQTVHKQAAEYLQALTIKRPRTPDEGLEEVDQWEKAAEMEIFAQGAIALVGSLDRIGYWDEIDQRLLRAQKAAVALTDTARLQAHLLIHRGGIAKDQGRWSEAAEFYQQALKLSSQMADGHNIALIYWRQGDIYLHKRDIARAIQLYEQALTIFEQIGDDQKSAVYASLGNAYLGRGEWDNAIEFYQKSLIMFEQSKDYRNIAINCGNLGTAYVKKGEWDQALIAYQQELAIFAQLGDDFNLSKTYLNLGTLYLDKEEWEHAIKFYQQTLSFKNQFPHSYSIAIAYLNLGRAYSGKEEWEHAIQFCQEALIAFERQGDSHGLAETYSSLGEIYLSIREWDRAIEIFQKVSNLKIYLNDERIVAKAYVGLGSAYLENSGWDSAISFYRQALAIFEQISDISGQTAIYTILGQAYVDKGEWNKAIEVYRKNLVINRQIGDNSAITQTYIYLGSVYYKKGEWNPAIEFFQQALHHREQIKNSRALTEIYDYLGTIYGQKGDWDRAIEYYQQDIIIKEQLDDQHGLAQTYNNLGNIYVGKQDWDQALKLYHQAIPTLEKLSDSKGLAQTYVNIGTIHLRKGEQNRAIELYQQALVTFEQLSDNYNIAQTYGNLGNAYLETGSLDRALKFYQQAVSLKVQIGDHHGLAQTYSNLGLFYYKYGDSAQAADYMSKAYLLFVSLGAKLEAQQIGDRLVAVLGSVQAANMYLANIKAQEVSQSTSAVQERLTLTQLLNLLEMVAQARRGDHTLGERLYNNFLIQSVDNNLPSEMQALYKILVRILAGIKNPNVSTLPLAWAEAVQGMLSQLANKREAR